MFGGIPKVNNDQQGPKQEEVEPTTKIIVFVHTFMFSTTTDEFYYSVYFTCCSILELSTSCLQAEKYSE
jgi:hypothetical protein